MDAKTLLDLPLRDNDAGAKTVRDYLLALLRELWVEEAGFSGKRPFGNSGWQYDIYVPMMEAGLIDGRLDEYGYVVEMDTEKADALLVSAIGELGS